MGSQSPLSLLVTAVLTSPAMKAALVIGVCSLALAIAFPVDESVGDNETTTVAQHEATTAVEYEETTAAEHEETTAAENAGGHKPEQGSDFLSNFQKPIKQGSDFISNFQKPIKQGSDFLSNFHKPIKNLVSNFGK